MPDWLPGLLQLNGSSIAEDYEKLFEVFKRDFIDSSPILEGKPVIFEAAPDKQDPRFPCGFTHLVTKGNSGQRFIDYERAPRLPWVRTVIDHCEAPEVTRFEIVQATKKHGLALNTYLWVKELDFVVILRDISRNNQTKEMLITSFCVEPWKRKQLEKLRARAQVK